MKEYIRLSVTLLIICAVAATLLSFTNASTRGIIEKNSRKEVQSALKQILPNAEKFEETTAAVTESAKGLIKDLGIQAGSEAGASFSFFKALDGTTVTGMALKISPAGFSGPITMMVGIDTRGAKPSIAGFKVLDHTETPGLGANIKEIKPSMLKKVCDVSTALTARMEKAMATLDNKAWFEAQFEGLAASDMKVDKDGGRVHSITAATISSRAVTKGLRQALELAAVTMGGAK
jgi:RnfABCDGE-type electron transport complex G subunit